uniref:DUF19 domain-containing protein n=1 Tax=Globodera pallida TaxID=36090 RepID=A0A183CBQ8_GLOPA
MACKSTLLFFATAIFCLLLCHLCIAQPRCPCCAGSQQLATLMSGYIVNFTNSADTEDKATLCQNVIDDVKWMQCELEAMNKCEKGGGARIFDKIDEQLTPADFWNINTDACAYSLSFIRAMFDLAAKATRHMKSSKWDAVTTNFVTQIAVIDDMCNAFSIKLLPGSSSTKLTINQ